MKRLGLILALPLLLSAAAAQLNGTADISAANVRAHMTFLASDRLRGRDRDFMAQHYHKPSDDLSQPIRYDAGAKFARLNYEITRELAEGHRPTWNKGDFFAAKFAKPK